jgi:hypothetical protein
MLGAPGEDGVFRYQPSPDTEPAGGYPAVTQDDDGIAEWMDTSSDPASASAVALAEAAARENVPPLPGQPVPEFWPDANGYEPPR